MKENPSTAICSRRAWVRGSVAGFPALLSMPQLLAQDARVGDVLQAMSSMTGSKLDERWVEPAAALISAILEDSKPLRSLDLGEIEPALAFSAR
jgi:hypothetical protein